MARTELCSANCDNPLTLNFYFQADDELAIFNEQRRDKKRNSIMILIVYVTMTGMIILDIISKYRSFAKYRESLDKESKRKIQSHKMHHRKISQFDYYNSLFLRNVLRPFSSSFYSDRRHSY